MRNPEWCQPREKVRVREGYFGASNGSMMTGLGGLSGVDGETMPRQSSDSNGKAGKWMEEKCKEPTDGAGWRYE